ncbi:MAG: methyltransferase [Clostridia bacterium]|nr:methyltransferase [Clostridia bacterium]
MSFTEEYIGSGITVLVSPEHTFGTDAVLLADFAKPKPDYKNCDLGSGCGIIPFLWLKKGCKDITAVEIQRQGYEQIIQSVKINNVSDRIKVYNADLRCLKGILPFGYFNLVTMNPPYTADGSGVKSLSDTDKIARHGTMCTFSDMCKTASGLLNYGGRFCVCIRPERLCELFKEMQKYQIEPKRMRLVSKTYNTKAWLVLVEGKRGGKSGITIEKSLYVYNLNNEYSEEMKKIYSDYLLENRGN